MKSFKNRKRATLNKRKGSRRKKNTNKMSKKIRGGACLSNPTEKGVISAFERDKKMAGYGTNELNSYIKGSLKCNNKSLIVNILKTLTEINDLTSENLMEKFEKIKQKIGETLEKRTIEKETFGFDQIYEDKKIQELHMDEESKRTVKRGLELMEEAKKKADENRKQAEKQQQEQYEKQQEMHEERDRENALNESPQKIDALVEKLSPNKRGKLDIFLKTHMQPNKTIGETIRNNIDDKKFYRLLMSKIHPDKCKEDPNDIIKCNELSQIIESIKPR